MHGDGYVMLLGAPLYGSCIPSIYGEATSAHRGRVSLP